MQTAICPGSFDPITLGHLDVIRRASKMFERVVVCVVANPGKHCAITLEERCEQVRRVTASIPNVEVDMWEGLLVDYADRYENPVVVRGLRALSDFEYEFMMALTNKKLNSRVETVFLASDERYMYLSSTTVRKLRRRYFALCPRRDPRRPDDKTQREEINIWKTTRWISSICSII